MPEFQRSIELPVDRESAFAYHARPGALERLSPPWERTQVKTRSGSIRDGDRVVLELRRGPLRIEWEAVHEGYTENRQFYDRQVRGPFARWYHRHLFEDADPDACRLTDTIEYRLGWLTRLRGRRGIERDLDRLFTWRHLRTATDLARQAGHDDQPRMRIAIGGASGLVGSALVSFLTTAGHDVYTLVRDEPRPGAKELYWKPSAGVLDADALEGFDAVVHLGGANIAGGLWTDSYKRLIRESRVDSTRLLAEKIAGLTRKPRVFICASAVGYYGGRGDTWIDEGTPSGEHFLADVCREWEAATQPAADAGVRVLNLRTGMVLSPAGGALKMMLIPFSLGLAGRIGSGRQYMSWIALDDLVGLIHHALHSDTLAGPVNATAPNPVTNHTFTKSLGKVLRRPTALPVPAWAVRLLLGELGRELILTGQRVRPTKATDDGFTFIWPELEDALRFELGRFEQAGQSADHP